MPLKRSRSTSSFRSRAKRARRTGSMYKGQIGLGKRAITRIRTVRLASKVNKLYGMIETKEITYKIESGQTLAAGVTYNLAHNQVYVVPISPFRVAQGASDAMGEGLQANRLGDRITIKGLTIKGMFHNWPDRPRVYYRVLLLKAAKGDTLDRSTLFKNNCDNKMIDQINTERFTILAQKEFTVTASNGGGAAVNNGAPTGFMVSGNMTRTFSMWIPGSRIVKGGNMQFENNGFQPKFFDYKICVVTYDHTNTLQDTSNIGFINCLYTKCYFKDA